jgi:hypothetical protein
MSCLSPLLLSLLAGPLALRAAKQAIDKGYQMDM